MNSKTPLKLVLDIVMIVLFVILLDAFGTGLVFHEIAGLLIFVLFMIHIIFNWSWVKNVTKNLFNSGFKKKAKLMYILNSALLIGISAIIITGILISQVIFNFGANGNNHILVAVHKWVSYACAGLLAIHLAVHWRYILVSVRRTSAAFEGGKIRRTIETLGAAALLLVVLYSQIIPSSDKAAQNTVQPKGPSQDTITTRRIDSSGNSGVYDQDYTILQDAQAGTGVTVSLSDYLDNMFCTVCDKHCPLLSLKCDRGNPQLQAAKIQYQKLYG